MLWIILYYFKYYIYIFFFYQTVHFKECIDFSMVNVRDLVTHLSSGTECLTVRHSFSICSTFRSSSGNSPSSSIRAESPLLNCDIRNSSRSKGSTASYDWGCRTKKRQRKEWVRTWHGTYCEEHMGNTINLSITYSYQNSVDDQNSFFKVNMNYLPGEYKYDHA